MTRIARSTDVRGALRARQRGFLLNPFRFGVAQVAALDVPMEGANGSTTFTDVSSRARALTNASSGVTISTTNPPSGAASSGRFPGANGNCLTLVSDANSPLTGDFAYETDVFHDLNAVGSSFGAAPETYFTMLAGANSELSIGRDRDGFLFFWDTTGYKIVSGPIPGGEWHKVKFERVGGVGRLYLDGFQVGNDYTTSLTYGTSSGSSEIVGGYAGGLQCHKGNLHNSRLYKSAAYGGAIPTGDRLNDWHYVNRANTSTTTSGTSLSLGATSLTAGNHIFVFVRYEIGATSVTVTDTAGNTYTSLSEEVTSNGACGRWFYCLNALGHASNVVTINWGAARSYRYAYTFQYAKAGAAAFDMESHKNVAAATSITSNSFSTSAPGLVLVGQATYSADSTANIPLPAFKHIYGNPYSQPWTWLTRAALSSQTLTVTGGVSSTRAICIAAFK